MHGFIIIPTPIDNPVIFKTFKFKNAILEIAFWARPI